MLLSFLHLCDGWGRYSGTAAMILKTDWCDGDGVDGTVPVVGECGKISIFLVADSSCQ